MKLRHLFMAVIAGAFAFTSCEEEIDLGVAKLSIDPLELTFGTEGASKSVTMVATRDWHISGELPDWIAVSPSSGKADVNEQTISVTVLENKGNDREAKINFTIGTHKAALTVKQQGEAGELIIKKGSGTKEDPFSVEGAIEYVKGLGANVESPAGIYVKGKISSVTTTFEASKSYGNATFDMVDTDESEEVFKAYQTYYLGNRKWKSGDKDVKAGDEVIVCGKVVLYKGDKGIETPETVGKGGSYIYSLNGETAEAQEVDYTKVPAKTVKEFIEAADTDNYYKLTGKVSRFNANYCSFDLTDESGTIYVYSVANKDEWSSKIKNDGTVTLAGQYEYYSAKSQHEVVNAVILSFEEGEPPVEQEVKSVTIAEFNAAPESSTQPYKLHGKIGGSINTQYGNFDLTDETGTVYVYGLTATNLGYGTKNDQSFSKLGLKAGDEITIIGYRGSYGDKIEVVYAYFVEKTGSGTGEEEDYTKAEAKTVTEFIALADKDHYYKLTGKVSKFNATYCSFDLTDDSGTIYVYSVDNKDEWKSKVKDGGTVVLAGKYAYYAAKEQHEVVNAMIISFEDGGEEPPVTEVKTVTVAEFNAAAESSTQKYQLTGKISGDINTVYGNFDLVDETGTVYVYGLTATDLGYGAKNDKSFESLKLAEGDVITIIGYRGSYNGKIEVLNAYFVEKVSSGASEDPYLTVKSISQTSTRGFTVTWETNVKSGTYFAWSLYRKTTEVEDGVAYAAMGRGTDMTTTSLNVYDGSADGAGWYEDLIPGETYYFAINFYDYSVSGDDPVVANDPEKAFFEAKDMTNPGTSTEVTINLTNATTFAADNGGDTLKNGFAATVAGWKVATYQYKSTSAPVTPDEYSMRVYKSAVFYIEAPDGVEIKSLVFKANNYSSGKYILDMTGVEGTSGTALADKSTETITWESSSSGITKVILQAAAGQTRLESVTVKY